MQKRAPTNPLRKSQTKKKLSQKMRKREIKTGGDAVDGVPYVEHEKGPRLSPQSQIISGRVKPGV